MKIAEKNDVQIRVFHTVLHLDRNPGVARKTLKTKDTHKRQVAYFRLSTISVSMGSIMVLLFLEKISFEYFAICKKTHERYRNVCSTIIK